VPPPSSTAPAPPEALPDVRRWRPSPADVSPACKVAAVRELERRGNGPGTALEVVAAQYGGILTDSASVLVVCRTWRRRAGEVVPGGRTFDVRLTRGRRGWRVTGVRPSRPGPRADRLTTAARRVLEEQRIRLPPAARADVQSGRVHDSVLTTMLALSRRYRIGVSVVRSGHPTLVFGTDRRSDHPQGMAFDTWSIDGHPVIDPGTPERLVVGYLRALADLGSDNVGGPYLVGAAPQFFSDATHRDHVHAGFAS